MSRRALLWSCVAACVAAWPFVTGCCKRGEPLATDAGPAASASAAGSAGSGGKGRRRGRRAGQGSGAAGAAGAPLAFPSSSAAGGDGRGGDGGKGPRGRKKAAAAASVHAPPPPPPSAPSPANPGWIGGACQAATDCAFPEARCLRDGFPNGACSRPCDGVCPNRQGNDDTDTFCVDGAPYGAVGGLCVSQCDHELFPRTGCPEGYACVDRNRHAHPDVVESVCLPAVPSPTSAACPGNDELVDLGYPDAGKVFLPREARCGGSFDLVVMMHGINPASSHAVSLGGGRRLELLVRHHIDAGRMRPLVLAEPVHLEATSARLYGPGYDPVAHLEKIETILSAKRIKLQSLSFAGHSGAGCHAGNGLYKVLDRLPDLVPAHAPRLALWGLMDVCYEDAYHWEQPLAALSQSNTAIVNMYSVQGDPRAFEEAMLEPSRGVACASELFASCLASTQHPWCSYRTRAAAGIDHDNNPYYFVREVFPRVFPATGAVTVCAK